MNSLSIPKLVASLQSYGIRIKKTALPRKGGAGPAEGNTIIIEKRPISIPSYSKYVRLSPFEIRSKNSDLFLFEKDIPIIKIGLVSSPRFYNLVTKNGISFKKIALLHGKDCLATTVFQSCIYWNSSLRCKFCGIELSLINGTTIREKSPKVLAQVAQKAFELDGVRHVVLTTGIASPPLKEIQLIKRCAEEIKLRVPLKIHAQFLPPKDLCLLEELKESGVDTVGIHIESFDSEILQKIAPVKANIGIKRFEVTWRKAVELFGVNQVSSFIIVGLGEKIESVLKGAELLSHMGVYPFIVPLRPIPGSFMEDVTPPDPKLMDDIYREVSLILQRKGLRSDLSIAGCVRCGACSALSFYERSIKKLTCHAVRNQEELRTALEIRRAVFVEEQGLFDYTDVDENDKKSTILVAKIDNHIVGTVRVYPSKNINRKEWVGGRLAIKKKYRGSGAAPLLVKEAMRYVKRMGCKRFIAMIQEENIKFFKRLGWSPEGPLKTYHGKKHQLMVADLNRI